MWGFLIRVGIFGAVSMAGFNMTALYLNTGSLEVEPASLFTVVRLRDNMEDVGKWAFLMTNNVVEEVSESTEEFRNGKL
jgi:hypothetical protein